MSRTRNRIITTVFDLLGVKKQYRPWIILGVSLLFALVLWMLSGKLPIGATPKGAGTANSSGSTLADSHESADSESSEDFGESTFDSTGDSTDSSSEPADDGSSQSKPTSKSSGTKTSNKKTSSTQDSAEAKQTKSNSSGKSAGSNKSAGASNSSGQSSQKEDSGFPSNLDEIGRETFKSPAGLIYGRGSEEGHRWKHVLRHTKDMPERPIHGVFDAKGEELVEVIDEAYQLYLDKSKKAKVREDRGRTVIEANLGRRVGFVGGGEGAKSKNPSANYIRLVIEEDRVISAFPVRL